MPWDLSSRLSPVSASNLGTVGSMGLMDELGYRLESPSGWRRLVVKSVAHEPLASVVRMSLRKLDELVLRVSGGRSTSAGLLTGFPVLLVTTQGAKSGQPRRVPLLAFPTSAGNLALLGTNFGQAKAPGWVHNIRANPDVIEIAWRDAHAKVTASRMSPEDSEQVWAAAIAAYPGYANYRTKAAHREISVFELHKA